MGTTKHFEEFEVWILAHQLVREIYSETKKKEWRVDTGLRDQIRRAAVSITSNIAEGAERGSNKDFSRFLMIARGSVGEVRSQLYIAVDEGYLTKDKFDQLKQQCLAISRSLTGFQNYLLKTDYTKNKEVSSVGESVEGYHPDVPPSESEI